MTLFTVVSIWFRRKIYYNFVANISELINVQPFHHPRKENYTHSWLLPCMKYDFKLRIINLHIVFLWQIFCQFTSIASLKSLSTTKQGLCFWCLTSSMTLNMETSISGSHVRYTVSTRQTFVHQISSRSSKTTLWF